MEYYWSVHAVELLLELFVIYRVTNYEPLLTLNFYFVVQFHISFDERVDR